MLTRFSVPKKMLAILQRCSLILTFFRALAPNNAKIIRNVIFSFHFLSSVVPLIISIVAMPARRTSFRCCSSSCSNHHFHSSNRSDWAKTCVKRFCSGSTSLRRSYVRAENEQQCCTVYATKTINYIPKKLNRFSFALFSLALNMRYSSFSVFNISVGFDEWFSGVGSGRGPYQMRKQGAPYKKIES